MAYPLRQLPRAIEWQAVSSSNVAAVAYEPREPRKPPCLWVRFLNGQVYGYEGVERPTWEAMLRAPSKGQFVWDWLRGRDRPTRYTTVRPA